MISVHVQSVPDKIRRGVKNNMPLVMNENEIKKPSQFLEYEVGDGGNILMIKSRLYQIPTHFVNSVKRAVLCKGEGECLYCAAYYPKKTEYNYMVYLNGQVGFIDIKLSVFFAIQQIAKAQRKDSRQISWTVIKTGAGLDTEYTTSKDDNLAPEDYERLQSELDANTDRLVEAMEANEERLEENYNKYIADIREQTPPKRAKKAVEETKNVEPAVVEAKEKAQKVAEEELQDKPKSKVDPDQDVQPDDIPF